MPINLGKLELLVQILQIMQIYTQLYQNRSSLFEDFLEELSGRNISVPLEDEPIEYLPNDFQEENSSSRLSGTQLIWGSLEQPLELDDPDEASSSLPSQSLEVELDRVITSRLSQQTKMSDYLAETHETLKRNASKRCTSRYGGYGSGKTKGIVRQTWRARE